MLPQGPHQVECPVLSRCPQNLRPVFLPTPLAGPRGNMNTDENGNLEACNENGNLEACNENGNLEACSEDTLDTTENGLSKDLHENTANRTTKKVSSCTYILLNLKDQLIQIQI